MTTFCIAFYASHLSTAGILTEEGYGDVTQESSVHSAMMQQTNMREEDFEELGVQTVQNGRKIGGT
jgi:hypothetical protein